MRYHHFTILFVIIFAVFSLRMSMSVSGYEKAADSYAKIERSFYAAADAAGEALCRYGISEIITDRGAAYDAFFNSMYASLGIMDNPAKKEEFLNYIPLFAVIENEGFYVYLEDEYMQPDGYLYGTENWSECMPYSHSDEDFVYRFTLDGDITMLDRNGLIDGTVRLYSTTQEELLEDPLYITLKTLRPNSFLFDAEKFLLVKQTAVTKTITDAMRYFVNSHNRVAQQRGIRYDFAVPVIDNATWNRSIEQPGVLVMIQGYPLDATAGIFFNRYAFVGSQLYKQEPYYITPWGWHPTYHRRSCEKLLYAEEDVHTHPYYSVEECVEKGAYACEECIPDGVCPPKTIYPIWSWE